MLDVLGGILFFIIMFLSLIIILIGPMKVSSLLKNNRPIDEWSWPLIATILSSSTIIIGLL